MNYSVNVNDSITSFSYCIQKVSNGIYDVEDWDMTIDVVIDYDGIYFNFNLDDKTLEISGNSLYKELDSLDEVIGIINSEYEE